MSDSFATPCTVACQAPLSMGFSRQKYWSGLPFPPPGDLPDPGIDTASPALAGGSFTEPPRKPAPAFLSAAKFWGSAHRSLLSIKHHKNSHMWLSHDWMGLRRWKRNQAHRNQLTIIPLSFPYSDQVKFAFKGHWVHGWFMSMYDKTHYNIVK